MHALIATAVLAPILAAIAVIDARTLRIPDSLSLPLIGLGLVMVATRDSAAMADHLIGAGAGFLVLAAIGEFHFRRRGTEGLGLGDAKLFGAAGAWLGWQALPQVLLIAAVGGLVHAVVRRKSVKGVEIAFGPWLAIGFGIAWIASLI